MRRTLSIRGIARRRQGRGQPIAAGRLFSCGAGKVPVCDRRPELAIRRLAIREVHVASRPPLRETGQCMVSLQELRHERRAAIIDLARRHGAQNIRVYGSVARGQANDSSDLDLLVEWEPGRSLLDVVALKQDLEDLLGVTVDIGSEPGLHWFIRDEVLREAVPL